MASVNTTQDFALLIRTLRQSDAGSLQDNITVSQFMPAVPIPLWVKASYCQKCPMLGDKLNGNPINRPKSEKHCLKTFFFFKSFCSYKYFHSPSPTHFDPFPPKKKQIKQGTMHLFPSTCFNTHSRVIYVERSSYSTVHAQLGTFTIPTVF